MTTSPWDQRAGPLSLCEPDSEKPEGEDPSCDVQPPPVPPHSCHRQIELLGEVDGTRGIPWIGYGLPAPERPPYPTLSAPVYAVKRVSGFEQRAAPEEEHENEKEERERRACHDEAHGALFSAA